MTNKNLFMVILLPSGICHEHTEYTDHSISAFVHYHNPSPFVKDEGGKELGREPCCADDSGAEGYRGRWAPYPLTFYWYLLPLGANPRRSHLGIFCRSPSGKGADYGHPRTLL